MPLYEYACAGCGHRFEVLQKMGAPSQGVTCPKCDGDRVVKQLSTFASTGTGTGSPASLPCGATSAASCGSGGFS